MRSLVTALALFGAVALAADGGDKKVTGPLSFTLKGIDGKPVELSQYQGKVVLFVNVASQCGYTKQYKGLQATYDKYKDKGFVIIGVPANEFGAQEPGTDAEIKEFCSTKYSVTFPMMSKVVVKGKGIAPLYDYLTGTATDPQHAGPIAWNFEKFLIGKSGQVVGRFKSPVDPEGKELTAAIEAELAK